MSAPVDFETRLLERGVDAILDPALELHLLAAPDPHWRFRAGFYLYLRIRRLACEAGVWAIPRQRPLTDASWAANARYLRTLIKKVQPNPEDLTVCPKIDVALMILEKYEAREREPRQGPASPQAIAPQPVAPLSPSPPATRKGKPRAAKPVAPRGRLG